MKQAVRRFVLPLAGLAVVVALCVAALGGGTASAASSGFGVTVFAPTPGTGPPPSQLGIYHMYQFGADPQPDCTDVTSVALPFAGPNGPTGSITFSAPVNHTVIGSCWATWSHGYTGDVYSSNGADTVTITLPPNTNAFQLYAEPNVFALFDITVTGHAGPFSGSATRLVNGTAGARYFGVYSTFNALTSVDITADPAALGFAVGEFGISGPKLYKVT